MLFRRKFLRQIGMSRLWIGKLLRGERKFPFRARKFLQKEGMSELGSGILLQ